MKDLILDLLEVTEAAALASYDYVGLGDNHGADKAAVEAMRNAFDRVDFQGRVVIGEGERDQAPMLFIGEQVGSGKSKVRLDLAVDPLEGTQICASYGSGAISVLAAADEGGFLHAPDIYMHKIAIGLPDPVVSLSASVAENLKSLARTKGVAVEQLTACILERKRHNQLIQEAREAGARIKLISDGDIAAVIATIISKEVDIYMGIGGSPEGVIAASALKSLGGYMEAKLIIDDPKIAANARSMGIIEKDKIYTLDHLVRKDSTFIATGVTGGDLLDGLCKTRENYVTFSSLIVTDGCINRITRTKGISKTKDLSHKSRGVSNNQANIGEAQQSRPINNVTA